MARYNDGLIPATPTVVSGVTAFGTHVNPFLAAALSGFSGTTRSDSATAGHIWAKEVAGGYELNLFAGSAVDVPLGTVTTATGVYTLPIEVIEAALASSGRGVPTGTIIMHGSVTPPPGYLKLNGAEYSRTTYAELFAVIGTTYGVGNGSTTFNVDDWRGIFPRGWDDGRGLDAGRVFGSEQEGTWLRTVMHEWSSSDAGGIAGPIGMPHASPDATLVNAGVGGAFPSGALTGGGSAFTSALTDNTINGTTGTAGGGDPVNRWIRMRPTNAATLFCIKY